MPASGDGTAAQAPPPLDVAAWSGSPHPKPQGPLEIHTDPGDLPHLELAGESGKRLPLEHTHVEARLTGFVSEVEVTQTYTNPLSTPIEAVYVFPLPENAAVHHMRMVIGRRVVEAKVRERRQARALYAKAKREGHTAALLEQERPNVFTQSVANIEPGKKIDVAVRYVQDLSYDAGEYEFVFPVVVGPRFMPGAPLGKPPSGQGTQPDTDRVPDASRISPPYVGRGERTGHDISLHVVADAQLAIGAFSTPTHQVVSRSPAGGSLELTLAEKKSIPNRDFVLRYRVAGERPKATLFLSPPAQNGGFFSLVVHPPNLDVDGLVGRREILFVVDVSGSMSGPPLSLCKLAMRDALSRLRPVDTFDVLTFAGETRRAFEAPRPANDANVREALAVVDGLQAGGGTQMLDAVQTALSTALGNGRDRYVFFLTDGYVGNEDEIIAASGRFARELSARGRRARVFGFGVGSSTNRYLIDGLSRAGRGLGVYASTREDPARAVNRFFRYIDRSVLTDVKVDWGDLGAADVQPPELPDLFASHPIVLHGRYTGRPSAAVSVRAKAGDREITLPVATKRAATQGRAENVLGSLWARAKVGSLEAMLWDGWNEAAERDITKLGLDFHLVTRFTSLLAVDNSRRVGDGTPQTIMQSLDEPEGVDVAMAGGHVVEYGLQDEVEKLEAPEEAPAEGATELAGAPAVRSQSGQRRGCSCRVVGAPDYGAGVWIGVAAIAVLVARRKARSGAAAA